MLKKIIISGSVFSGKQTAIHILDNNQDIMINLIHDCMINALKYFYSLNNVENNSQGNKLIIFKKDNKKIELTEKNFNDSLEHTNFNKTIKKYADEGKIPNKFSNLKMSITILILILSGLEIIFLMIYLIIKIRNLF